jgi:hypothetical protein
VWLAGFILTGERIRVISIDSVPVIAVAGALGGLLGGLFIGLSYEPSDPTPRILVIGGAATGALGGSFTLPTVSLCLEWIDPLTSSTLLWCIVGFCAGVSAYRWSSRTPEPSAQVDAYDWDAEPAPASEGNRSWGLVRLLPFLATLLAVLIFLAIITTRYIE